MPHRNRQADQLSALRRRAEQAVRELESSAAPEAPAPETLAETRRLLHELRVHQVELEMQNEELYQTQLELEVSRERYFDLYDLAPVAYLVLDEQGLILEANLTAALMLGRPRRTLAMLPISRFILPEDQDRYYLQRKRLLATREAQTFEVRFLRQDAGAQEPGETPFWVQLNAMLARDAGGASLCRLVLSDISALKQAEVELSRLNEELESRIQQRTTELRCALDTLHLEVQERRLAAASLATEKEKFRTIADNTFDWEEWVGPDGTFIYVSPSCERITGYAPAEFHTDPGLLLRIVHPEDAPLLEGLHARIVEHADHAEREFRIRARDGSTHWISHLCQPVYSADGVWLGQRSSNRDISDRKAAEAVLRQSEEQYSTVVENSPTGICILRGEELLFANQRFFGIVMRAPAERARLNPLEFLHPEDRPAISRIWASCLAGNCQLQAYECRVVCPDGTVRWISGRSTAISYRHDVAVLVNVQDVTERHEAVRALRESQEALQGLSTRLISIQEEERQRVARELHDSIGSSLSAIKLMVEAALETAATIEDLAHVEALRKIVPVIQSSVEEVRRISMALRPLTLDDLGLLTTIAWALREFQSVHPDVHLEQRLTLAEEDVPDPLKISIFRILQEALTNTARHGRAERIAVSLRREAQQIILEVEDNGVGFDPTRPRPLDASGGTGLASMRERAQLTGGELSVLTAPGRGTRIRCHWPRA